MTAIVMGKIPPESGRIRFSHIPILPWTDKILHYLYYPRAYYELQKSTSILMPDDAKTIEEIVQTFLLRMEEGKTIQ